MPKGEKTKLLWENPEYKKRMSDLHLGQKVWNKGIKTGIISKTIFKKGNIPWNKDKEYFAIKGENNGNWKGGIYSLKRKIRNCKKYRAWRNSGFKRDDYICQVCRIRGGILHFDHINPFAVILYKNKIKTLEQALNCEELWDLNNGRTLCINCHKQTSTYFKSNITQQYA